MEDVFENLLRDPITLLMLGVFIVYAGFRVMKSFSESTKCIRDLEMLARTDVSGFGEFRNLVNSVSLQSLHGELKSAIGRLKLEFVGDNQPPIARISADNAFGERIAAAAASDVV